MKELRFVFLAFVLVGVVKRYQCLDCKNLDLTAASTTCTTETNCYVKFNADGTVIERGCIDSCDSAALEYCCASNDCNVGTISSCMVDTGSDVNTDIGTSTLCESATNEFCKNTISGAGIITDRACADACTPSTTETCCDTDDCNDGTILSCYVGTGLTSNTDIGTMTACDATARYCKNTIDADGLITDRECAAACTPSDTVACCESDNCNDGTVASCMIGADLTVNTDDGTATTCELASAKYCKNIINGDGLITDRECADTCIPSATEACCSTNDCNDATVITNTCYQTDADEDSIHTYPCASDSPICIITFNGTGAVLEKSCEKVCVPSATEACCEGNDCNSATELLTCYQCDNADDCASNGEGEACHAALSVCQTILENGDPLTKSCVLEADCEESTDTTCCDTDNCNDEEAQDNNAVSKSINMITCMIPVFITLLNEIKKYYF